MALQLLERVRRNAQPLLRAHGWIVQELVELCCCSAAPESAQAGTSCWCLATSEGTALRIALRLRNPKTHELLQFEQVFGAMLHAMCHIRHGQHSAQFHLLQDRLHGQWERLMAAGATVDVAGCSMPSGRAVRCTDSGCLRAPCSLRPLKSRFCTCLTKPTSSNAHCSCDLDDALLSVLLTSERLAALEENRRLERAQASSLRPRERFPQLKRCAQQGHVVDLESEGPRLHPAATSARALKRRKAGCFA